MINARDLLPMSWIAFRMGIQRVISMKPANISPDYPPLQVKWLINGDEEEAYSGIPLTQEMLRRNRWDLHQDDEWITSYHLPNNYFVTWVNHNSPFGPDGTIISGPGEKVIQFVHELQLQYFATTNKHLQFDL